MGVLQSKSERLSNSLLEFEQIEIELEFTYTQYGLYGTAYMGH